MLRIRLRKAGSDQDIFTLKDDHPWFVLEDDWSRVLTDDVLRSLSAPVYYRDLDTTTFKESIDSEGRLILEDPQPGVPGVGAYNPPGYAQPPFDQYYQQYPPLPPQYPPQDQQQQDDDE
uniref:Uncharacterized protein n=1 Tax=Tanacetum cinerariifolium TaxID=118510 RepID=A0A699J695_TANCI|nr:hypothetical protein [Tanacetum cinerariifolium]